MKATRLHMYSSIVHTDTWEEGIVILHRIAEYIAAAQLTVWFSAEVEGVMRKHLIANNQVPIQYIYTHLLYTR